MKRLIILLLLLGTAAAQRADAALQTGRARGVLTEREKAADRHFALGMHHYERGRYGEAAHEWRTTLDLDPQHTAARAHLEKAVRKHHTLWSHRLQGKDLLSQSRYEEAAREFAVVVAANPYDETARRYLEICYRRQGKPVPKTEPRREEPFFLPDEPGRGRRRRRKKRESVPRPPVAMMTPAAGASARSDEAWVSFQLQRAVSACTVFCRAATSVGGETAGKEEVRLLTASERSNLCVQSWLPAGLVHGNRYDLTLRITDVQGRFSALTNRGIVCDDGAPVIREIRSSSHPDETRWYADPRPAVSWEAEDDLSFVMVFLLISTNSAESVSTILAEFENDSHTFATDDHTCRSAHRKGQWYAHLVAVDAAGNLSDVRRLSIRIGK